MTIDTEELRRVADFQDFAEHADLIRAAAQALDDFELARGHAAAAKAEALREASDLLVAECSSIAAPCFCSSAPWLRDRADALERGERSQ